MASALLLRPHCSCWRTGPFRLLLSMLAALLSAPAIAAPDLIVVNGNVHTVDPAAPRVEAFAVEAGRFTTVGSSDAIRALANAETVVIDARGHTVTPGFIDAHSHISGNSRPVAGVDIAYIADKDEWLQRILEADDRMPTGEWITGGGWDHTLSDGEYPTRAMLDRIVPERPVFLSHIDGHYAWVNSKALELAGVTADTPVPAGGEIVLDEETGEPMGILLEGAMSVVRRVIPDRSDAQRREGLAAMQQYANSVGITGLHQMGGLQDWLHIVERGDPSIRVWYGERGPEGADAEYAAGVERILALQQETRARSAAVAAAQEVGPLLELGFVKLMNDGVLSAHTAVLLDAYTDRPGWRGDYITSPQELAAQVRKLTTAGLPVAIHSIGDAAVRDALDAFESAKDIPVPFPNRIEHIELVHPDDVPRFRELGVVASMQPNHATNAIGYVPVRVGTARESRAYVWRSMLDEGVTLVFSADYGTSPLDPLVQIADAVFRESPFGFNEGKPWQAQEAISFAEALHAYTRAGAAITPWKDEIGAIAPGRWADFVILDGTVPEPMDPSFRALGIERTFFAGRQVHPLQ